MTIKDVSFPQSQRVKTLADKRAEAGRADKAARARQFTDLGGALAGLSSARNWLFEGAIEGNPIAVIAGPEKKDKSWALMQGAIACATGGKWLGAFACKRPGPVVYLDSEYGEHEFARRFARLCRGMGHRPEDVAPLVKHYYSRDLSLNVENEAAKWLLREAIELRPTVIMLDPWRNLLDGDENSAPDTLAGLNVCAQVRDQTGAAMVLAHHLNKQGTQSGSRALMTRADLIFEGTDEDTVWYSTRGRTIRRADPINKRFTLAVTHDDDENDLVAKTRVGLRFEGEATARNCISRTAARVRDALAGSSKALGHNDLRRLTKISNGKEIAKALWELSEGGIAKQGDDKRWSLATGEFFEKLGEESVATSSETGAGDDIF